MINKENKQLSINKQCDLLSINRSGIYYVPVPEKKENLEIMRVLDEQYLEADVQYGGIDQRKILVFAREYLPKIGYSPRIEVMTPLIPGLIGKKMSASDAKSKIDLLDDEKVVKQKLNNAEMVEGNPDNGVMAFLK